MCHGIASHSTGPMIKGTFGNLIASKKGFTYSKSLTSKGVKWTEKTLDKFLQSPADYAPGNAMALAGIPDSKDRADLIAYIEVASK